MPGTKSPVPFLDLPAQQARIRDDLRRRLDAVLAHCQFILGPEVAELERELAAFCGAKHCVSVSSGTDALQIAMMAENIGRGDAVFLPAFTYTATAEVPLVLGATPVFVDVDPRTYQIDPGAFAATDRRGQGSRETAAARRDWRRSVRSAGGLAGAFGDRGDRRLVHDRRSGAEFRSFVAWASTRVSGRCDGDFVFSVEAVGSLWRRRCAVYRERRTRGSISQPAHAWRRQNAVTKCCAPE